MGYRLSLTLFNGAFTRFVGYLKALGCMQGPSKVKMLAFLFN